MKQLYRVYFIKPPAVFRWFYRKAWWRIPTSERVVYLSFDDGPTPLVTEWVLDQLKTFQARATFFCIGSRVMQHPEIFQRIKNEGHSVGNHTMYHANGWRTDDALYLAEVKQCELLVNSRLFRPPYGKLRRSQWKALRNKLQVVMWDLMPRDFDNSVTADACVQRVMTRVRSGSIIVLHDSEQCADKLRELLPRLLGELNGKGFRMDGLVGNG
jgi:peptidoglycan/xylan/chitin deacetylase (PgdA/CDA1 family)